MRLPASCAALLLAAAAADRADALPVRWDFTGTVTNVSGNATDLAAFASLGVEVGATVTGSVVFESTTPDSQSDPNQGIYEGAFLSYGFSIGGYGVALASSTDQRFLVELGYIEPNPDDSAPSHLNLFARVEDSPDLTPPIPPLAGIPLAAGLSFLGPGDQQVLDSDELPLASPDLLVFTGTGSLSELQCSPSEGGAAACPPLDVRFDIESVVLVPEAASSALLGAVWFALGSKRSARHARRRT